MSREIDRRDFSVNKIDSARQVQLGLLADDASGRLAGSQRFHIAEFDASTGNPSRIISTSAATAKGNYFQRALDHVREIAPILGLTPSQPAEFAGDPNVQQSSSGGVAVHLRQQYKGIDIFHAAVAVRFTPDGAINDIVGSAFTVNREIELSAKLSVKEALRKAAEYIANPHPDVYAI